MPDVGVFPPVPHSRPRRARRDGGPPQQAVAPDRRQVCSGCDRKAHPAEGARVEVDCPVTSGAEVEELELEDAFPADPAEQVGDALGQLVGRMDRHRHRRASDGHREGAGVAGDGETEEGTAASDARVRDHSLGRDELLDGERRAERDGCGIEGVGILDDACRLLAERPPDGEEGARRLDDDREAELDCSIDRLVPARAHHARGRYEPCIDGQLVEQNLVEGAQDPFVRRQAETDERLDRRAACGDGQQRCLRARHEDVERSAPEDSLQGLDVSDRVVPGIPQEQTLLRCAAPVGDGGSPARNGSDVIACGGQPATGGERGALLRVRDEDAGSRGHQENPARGTPRPTTVRVSPRAAAQVPATKRITGPNDGIATAPRKCRPGTDDSKPIASTGWPSRVCTRRSRSGERNG